MINFTQIPDKLQYPPSVRAKLSTLHSELVTYVSSNFRRTFKYRQQVVNVLNTLSYIVISSDSSISSWDKDNPFALSLDYVDDDTCKSVIGKIYLDEKNINWDVKEVEYDVSNVDDTPTVETATTVDKTSTVSKPVVEAVNDAQVKSNSVVESNETIISPTPKSDLYLRSPAVPQFDIKDPWKKGYIGNDLYVIYKSLPAIPTKQNEISVTTDVSSLTSTDLIKLYPNRLIHTRASSLYENVPDLECDPDLGVILPIEGFTPDQVRDNIIKYPHLYKLSKLVEGKIVSFYTTIEIDGELHKTMDIWDSLSDSIKIPRSSDFIKEYVARRYLLERDIRGVVHKYPMYGTLDPFLTLFTTPEHYIKLGYTDTLDIAKQCVESRVSYKQSRNPILRRLENA